MSLPEKTEELKTILPAEVLTKSTPEGITALARAACWCSQDMYTEIFLRVAKAIHDPKDPQPLDPFLVNSIWLDETASREKALVGHLSVKTTVLTHLLKEHFVVEANPSITSEELRDAIAKQRKETNYDPTIPTFSHNLIERYDEPPYFFLFAQIQLNQNQELVNYCLNKLAKKFRNKTYKDLVNRPLSKIKGQVPEQMAELLAEELKQSRQY
ncbi:hypothetical protein KKE48_04175 [Patescibacteria group bacterium]|nr:hypothetical protein [Patescibacteria group bacterium]